MPAISRIPPNLSPEEKQAFVRERNRLKTQRLRARKKEQVQALEKEENLVSSAEARCLLERDGGESSGSSSSGGELREREGEGEDERRPAAKVRKVMGKDEAEKEFELELVVQRMKRKLVELGVGEEEISRMLRGGSDFEEEPCSPSEHRELLLQPRSSSASAPFFFPPR